MIRRQRVDINQTKTGHERWLVSYADFITLLFGFFVVMYSVSQVSEQKYRALSETLSSTFDGNRARKDKTPDATAAPNGMGQSDSLGGGSLADVKTLAVNLAEILAPLIRSNDISILATEEWLEIDLNANLLFASGSAELSQQAREIFTQLAQDLAPYHNEIAVSGHTDTLPIATDEFASNWELSSARAVSVVRVLSGHGVQPGRLSAVGHAEFRPVATNETAEGRAANRRVVLRVAAHQPAGVELPPPTIRPAPPLSASTGELPSVDNSDSEIEPVRLENGGLLFTSDPDLPRNIPPK